MDSIPITLGNVIFAFAGASFVFLVFKFITAFIQMAKGIGEIGFNPSQREEVLMDCCLNFPMESLQMDGSIFTRGESVRITTKKELVYEGQFVGVNKSEMLCIITDKSIIAHALGTIMKIQSVK